MTDSHPASQPASHVAVAKTRYAMASRLKMSNYVHRQWEVMSYLSVQLMWSHTVQFPGSQVYWDQMSCLDPLIYTRSIAVQTPP